MEYQSVLMDLHRCSWHSLLFLFLRYQPIAVIICPGWEKVESVLDLIEESKAAVKLHPAAVLVGVGKNEAKQTKIQNNCKAPCWF